MKKPYTVSAQLLESGGRKAAQWDSWPGGLDTSTLSTGQRIEDRRELTVYTDAVPGAYGLRIMVYDGQTMERMRVIDDRGRVLPDDFFTLDRVRVLGPGR
jgi:hypothetical protein